MTNEEKNEQVTVIARHNVRAGKVDFFENWLAGIEKAAQSFTGFLGTEIIKPVDGKALQYVCIFRFDKFLHLEEWMESKSRTEWLSQCSEFSDIEPEYEHYQHHGMNILLGKDQAGNAASSVQTILLSILGLALPVHFVPPIVASYIQFPAAITLISLALIVPLMVFLMMPLLAKILGRWIS